MIGSLELFDAGHLLDSFTTKYITFSCSMKHKDHAFESLTRPALFMTRWSHNWEEVQLKHAKISEVFHIVSLAACCKVAEKPLGMKSRPHLMQTGGNAWTVCSVVCRNIQHMHNHDIMIKISSGRWSGKNKSAEWSHGNRQVWYDSLCY